MIHTESIRQEQFHWHIAIQSVKGLGRTIVTDVEDAHGDWIRVETQEGKGTMFVFSLLFEPPRQDAINA
jgi:signal transduction histidine kinase